KPSKCVAPRIFRRCSFRWCCSGRSCCRTRRAQCRTGCRSKEIAHPRGWLQLVRTRQALLQNLSRLISERGMLLTRKSGGATSAAESPFVHSLRRGIAQALPTMDRRTFLRRSGVGVGAGLVASQLTLVKKAQAASESGGNLGKTDISVRRTVCTHCSVGCAIDAVVENGVWIRQEPVFDSPINLGAHCAKGASVREHGHGEHRLRYPMKLVNGKYERISWDTALEEISARLLKLREESGPDSVYWIGSSKHNNEQAYLMRK